MNTTALFLTWESHARSRSLARELNVEVFEILYSGNRIFRYCRSLAKTFGVIKRKRPKVVIHQNPSIVLALNLLILRFVYGYKLIMDAHNSAIFPLEGRFRLLNWIAIRVVRSVDFVIVTNLDLYKYVVLHNPKCFVLSDPLPDYSAYRKSGKGPDYILLICTWADDEPYEQVIEAGEAIQNLGLEIWVTGRPPLLWRKVQLPKNVKLLGFVDDAEYVRLLKSAFLIIDLTTRDSCLVCGAYEAVEAGVPAIISDSKVNKEIFYKGFVHSKNDSSSIKKAISFASSSREFLENEMREFRVEYNDTFSKNKAKLLSFIGL